MIKLKLGILLFLMFTLSLSCNKKSKKIRLWEELNGSYSGNIYKWTRDYDSTHQNVVETRDTIFNVNSELDMNFAANTISFGGIQYKYHDDLEALLDKDTIEALLSYSNLPRQSIRIIRSSKFVRVGESGYSPIGGPWAYSIAKEYYKR